MKRLAKKWYKSNDDILSNYLCNEISAPIAEQLQTRWPPGISCRRRVGCAGSPISDMESCCRHRPLHARWPISCRIGKVKRLLWLFLLPRMDT